MFFWLKYKGRHYKVNGFFLGTTILGIIILQVGTFGGAWITFGYGLFLGMVSAIALGLTIEEHIGGDE